jgi:hypothetical protein
MYAWSQACVFWVFRLCGLRVLSGSRAYLLSAITIWPSFAFTALALAPAGVSSRILPSPRARHLPRPQPQYEQ